MLPTAPLADRCRPTTLDEVVGQAHLVGEHGILRKIITSERPLSLILWGPPGCGKTTLARIYSKAFRAQMITFSAVLSGIAELRKAVQQAEEMRLIHPYTVLFVDEIHRWNKAQQDAFLPHLENGTLILVGATTENPSFSLNDALLSRTRVVQLYPLDSEDLLQLVSRYEDKNGALPLEEGARPLLIEMAQGDARYLYNLLENLSSYKGEQPLTAENLGKALQKRAALYDRSGDRHYDLISALHKSVRGSDPDAALYWLCRMLGGGEDPLFIARRLIRMATEDIGLADPEALKLAIAARDAYQMLGSPEGELALAEVVVYLALAPKSNAVYVAYGEAKAAAAQSSHLPPPLIIRNAPTRLMKELDYGKGYQYDHEAPDSFSGQNYFPDGFERPTYYQPVERGYEREMAKRLAYFSRLRSK